MSRSSRKRADRSRSLVGFIVDSVHYAVAIESVREIINPLPIVPLPHAPAAVLGLADHRGEAIPILDLRVRLGLSPASVTRRTKWILVNAKRGPVGLVVDGVTEVFGPGEGAEREVPELGLGDRARGLSAVYGGRGGLTYVIDVPRMTAGAGSVTTLVEGT